MFKKLFTIAGLIGCTAVPALAQDYSVFANPVDSTTTGTPVKTPEMEGYPYLELANHLTNITQSPVTIKWKIVEVSIPSDWKMVGMCDNNTCYIDDNILNGTAAPPPTQAISPGGNSLFDLRVYVPYTANTGSGFVKIRTNTLSQVDTLTFRINKTATSVATIELEDKRVSLSPNPATNNLRVFTDKGLNPKSIAVVSMNGAQVMNATIEKGNENTDININSLATGTYMIRINDAKGNMITSRKFVKK